MDLVLVQQENIAGAPVEAGVEVEARLIFRGAHPCLGPPRVSQCLMGSGHSTSLHATEATPASNYRAKEHCLNWLLGLLSQTPQLEPVRKETGVVQNRSSIEDARM